MFTLSSTLLKEYQKLLSAVQKGQNFTAPYQDINDVVKGCHEIYVKRIGEFSSFLHSFQVDAASLAGEKHEFEFRGLFVRRSRSPFNRGRVQALNSNPICPAPWSASPAGPRSPSS